jgi:hypothetical protein
MGLEEDAWQKLGFLQVGEALIKTSYMDRPAKSAGFDKYSLSAGPLSSQPNGDGWSPSFTKLTELWRPVLRGTSSEPQTEWVSALISTAGENYRLALFAGLRTFLMEKATGASGFDSRALRDLLASTEPTAASILECSKAAWSAVVSTHYSRELVEVASSICAALVPSSAWRKSSFSADGIVFVSATMARAGFGTEDEWVWALNQIRLDRAPERARKVLVMLAGGGTDRDRTAGIRTLICMTPKFKEWGQVHAPPRPATLLSEVGFIVTTMLFAEDDNPDHERRREACSLVAEIEERLTMQLATRWGATYEREVREFLSRMTRLQ